MKNKPIEQFYIEKNGCSFEEQDLLDKDAHYVSNIITNMKNAGGVWLFTGAVKSEQNAKTLRLMMTVDKSKMIDCIYGIDLEDNQKFSGFLGMWKYFLKYGGCFSVSHWDSFATFDEWNKNPVENYKLHTKWLIEVFHKNNQRIIYEPSVIENYISYCNIDDAQKTVNPFDTNQTAQMNSSYYFITKSDQFKLGDTYATKK